MTTGERIKAAREAAGLTQQQLGEAVGLVPTSAQPHVASWERGDRPIPRKRLKDAARVLGLRLSDLI